MNPSSLHAAYWERLGVLLPNTLVVSGLTTLLAGAFGLALGVLLFGVRVRGARVYRALLAAALFIPLHTSVTAWLALYWRWRFTLPEPLVAALLMWPTYAPLMAWITGLGIALVDPDHEDAARLDARWPRVFRHVVLPETAPLLWAGLLLVFILSAGEIVATDVLRIRTFAEEIFTQFQLRQGGQVAVDCLILLLLILLLAALLVGKMRRLSGISLEGLARRLGRRGPVWPAPFQRLLTFLAGALLLCLLGVPLVFLLHSLEGAGHFLETLRVVHEELFYTLWVGALSALLLSVLGTVLAWPLVRSRHRAAWLLVPMILALLPGPLVGYGLIWVFNRPGWLGRLYDSPAILIVTYLVRFLPLMVLIACPFVGRIPAELREAGAIDGAGGFRFLGFILLPLCRPLLAVLALFSLALVVGETGATALIAPPGPTMLSVRIFTLLHYGVYYDVAGAALLLFIPMALLGFCIFFLAEKLVKDS